MNDAVKQKRADAEALYKKNLKSIKDFVEAKPGDTPLADLEKLMGLVEAAREACKEFQLWDGVVKSDKGEKNA
jgi:hypothetical protein